MAFHIVRNNIVNMKVDAIVNSANPKPTYAYGTDLAVFQAAGAEQLLKEREYIGDILPGDVAVTSPGKLKVKYIIHTVGPNWEGGNQGEFEILKSCYEKSLQKALKLNCKSIAFPLISTGVYRFPKDKALEIATSAIQSFLLNHDMKVYLVVFDEKSFVLSGKIFDEIQEYIDQNYVEDVHKMEYIPEKNLIESGRRLNFNHGTLEVENDKFEKNCADEVYTQSICSFDEIKMDSCIDDDLFDEEIESMLDQDEQTFQEKLFEHIDRKQLKSTDIYKPIEMSKQTYSKIQSNKFYQPKKNTALLLCIVLHLNVAEADDLLSRAGYAFNPSSKQDLVVKACLLKKQYDFFVIDGILFKNHLDTLINYER